MLDDAALALEEIEPNDKTRTEVLGARVNLYMAARKLGHCRGGCQPSGKSSGLENKRPSHCQPENHNFGSLLASSSLGWSRKSHFLAAM